MTKLLLLALPTLVLGLGAQSTTTVFTASLTGEQQVPPITTAASGWATVILEEPSNQVRIHVQNTTFMTQTTVAHLHAAPAGVIGPIRVSLIGGPRTWHYSGILPAVDVASLKSGNTYLNVHSVANLNGEVRGQVILPVSSTWRAECSGAQVVPPSASTATVSMQFTLLEPDDILCWSVRTQGLAPVLSCELRSGGKGTNGPMLQTLNLYTWGTAGGSSGIQGVTALSRAEAIMVKSGMTYVQLNTTANPNGDVRGQLDAFEPFEFGSTMTGAQMVPQVTTATVGMCSLTPSMQDELSTLALAVVLAGPTGGHGAVRVYSGAPSTNGSLVRTFTPTWVGMGTTLFRSEVQVPMSSLSTNEWADLRAGKWYVTAATTANPNGEVRGQLVPVKLGDRPVSIGSGCPDSSGRVARVQSRTPIIGCDYRWSLYGGKPGASAVYALGYSVSEWGGAQLPFDLTSFGAPNCALSSAIIVLSPLFKLDQFGMHDGGSLIVAPNPSVRGGRFTISYLILDAAANAFGIVPTNAMWITVW